MSKYKTTGKQTLFDAENAAQKLSEIGNPLEKLDSVIDFEMFRSRLEEAMVNHNTKSNAGAKQYDVVMRFKEMVLRQYCNLSYEQMAYQIIDRSSFTQFLGLASGDKVPDSNTIRNFFEGLKEKGLGGKLFQDFVDNLLEKGFIFNEGQIVDACFVLALRQRNTREEKKNMKKVPWTFDSEAENLDGKGDELCGTPPHTQEVPQGHRRAMGKETRRKVLWVQGQRGDMQQDQTHPQPHRVCRQPSRLQRDRTRADGTAQGGPR